MTSGKMNTSPTTRSNTALIIGATSSLAQALCRTLAARGYSLILAGRDTSEIELLMSDLAVRYRASCRMLACDFMSPNFSVEQCVALAGDFTHVFMLAGDMGNGQNNNAANIALIAHLNYVAPAQLSAALCERLCENGGGTVVIVSSVAGDRGRQSNYAYGSAKAALTAFASGLRNAYARRGVHVMTVKPGFVDTPMTWNMDSPLIARREYVARKIVEAMEKRKDSIYVPFFWTLIMLIICHIPERIFKKLKL